MAHVRFNGKTLRITDPLEMPIYSIPAAAHYLRLPVPPLRSWVAGRSYQVKTQHRRFRPLIQLPDSSTHLLSFNNLAEAHVLAAFRRVHGIPLASIRKGMEYVRRLYGLAHPLLEQEFATDGVGLFIDHLGQLRDASHGGQLVIRQVVEAHLQRLEREHGQVVRLWPFTRAMTAAVPNSGEPPRTVFMDPRFAFGQPVLASKRIPTAAIAQRYKAGESIEDLANDYGCEKAEIEEGIRCELDLRAAA